MKIGRNIKGEIIRFFLAGAIVTATDFSIYYFLFHFLSFSLSKGISFTCAGIVGYLLNKYWTFKHNRRSYAEIGRYTLINFLALGINILVNQSILNARPNDVGLAFMIATLSTSVFVFICFKWWVYRTQLAERH